MATSQSFRTVVIGGGQAGLASAFYLSRANHDFVVLDSHPRIGEAWRLRWDSLRLFTPSKFNGLPGMPFPGADFSFPTKDEVSDYLQAYAVRYQLPARAQCQGGVAYANQWKLHGCCGRAHFHRQERDCGNGPVSGAPRSCFCPRTRPGNCPDSFEQLSKSWRRFLREMCWLRAREILVLRSPLSWLESGRKVWLAGRDVGRIPANELGPLFGGRPYWAFISRVLSIDTVIGRKVRQKALYQGTPLIRLKAQDIASAGVLRRGRVAGIKGGRPELEDGRILDVTGVVWATGFQSDYRWIRLPIFDEHGYPRHTRGSIPQVPGLCFVGLHFQTALTSAFLGGVSRDAKYVTEQLR